MKYITDIIKNIKNLIPYFLLIALYFFFVNLEAGNDMKTNRKSENKDMINEDESSVKNKVQRIKIPVIPYKK